MTQPAKVEVVPPRRRGRDASGQFGDAVREVIHAGALYAIGWLMSIQNEQKTIGSAARGICWGEIRNSHSGFVASLTVSSESADPPAPGRRPGGVAISRNG